MDRIHGLIIEIDFPGYRILPVIPTEVMFLDGRVLQWFRKPKRMEQPIRESVSPCLARSTDLSRSMSVFGSVLREQIRHDT